MIPTAYDFIKRAFDLIVIALVAPVLLPIGMIVGILIKITSQGPVLYWSNRVGRDDLIFSMPKFRTMRVGTPQVATDLLTDPASVLTPIGSFLRKSSLDEIPQLWSILRGDMSLVGPRPALFNQHDLIARRAAVGVSRIRPGVTGLAQVRGRDDLSQNLKLEADAEYLRRRSLSLDCTILLMTAVQVIRGKGVKH